MVRDVANACMNHYPYRRHAEREQAAYELSLYYIREAALVGGLTFPSNRAWSLQVNDIIDVWDWLLEGNAL